MLKEFCAFWAVLITLFCVTSYFLVTFSKVVKSQLVTFAPKKDNELLLYSLRLVFCLSVPSGQLRGEISKLFHINIIHVAYYLEVHGELIFYILTLKWNKLRPMELTTNVLLFFMFKIPVGMSFYSLAMTRKFELIFTHRV